MSIVDTTEPVPVSEPVPAPEPPTIEVVIAAGDLVQATRVEPQPDGRPEHISVEVFTVGRVLPGGAVAGCSRGVIDPADRWRIELLSKGPANLELPEEPSELAVVLRGRQTVHVIGKAGNFRDAGSGELVADELIVGKRPWLEWNAEAEAYREHVIANLPDEERAVLEEAHQLGVTS